MFRRLVLLTCSLLLAGSAVAQDVGVVMLHGKWGRPGTLTLPAVNAIEQQGWPVIELTMPWAGNRLYDASYESALGQIADAVKALRAKGVKRVVVAGQSFGANATLAYAGHGGDLDGMIAMAPGHAPQKSYERGTTKAAVDQAREMVAAGKGGDRLDFVDTNVGKPRNLSARADVFLSYFDPNGMGNMEISAGRIARPIPLLWVVGAQDPLNAGGHADAYDKAPAHPLNRYVTVEADHMQTAAAAGKAIVDWLKLLAAQP